jgi:hypothetical protein
MAPVVVSFAGIVGVKVFIVIGVSIEKRAGACSGAEAATESAIRAVGAEVPSADRALFEARDLFGVAANNALPVVARGHGIEISAALAG